eukprot:TRINITY_DN3524_c0_g1_i1.p1 TRINITY_DN3524_c0_g1~~TRINITY_DN3524_c0_g1_i1.p1  ORF type:complete len:400 (-),score=90.74 TRINITY_DN3524_c0_g1_i1:385-1584(-)
MDTALLDLSAMMQHTLSQLCALNKQVAYDLTTSRMVVTQLQHISTQLKNLIRAADEARTAEAAAAAAAAVSATKAPARAKVGSMYQQSFRAPTEPAPVPVRYALPEFPETFTRDLKILRDTTEVPSAQAAAGSGRESFLMRMQHSTVPSRQLQQQAHQRAVVSANSRLLEAMRSTVLRLPDRDEDDGSLECLHLAYSAVSVIERTHEALVQQEQFDAVSSQQAVADHIANIAKVLSMAARKQQSSSTPGKTPSRPRAPSTPKHSLASPTAATAGSTSPSAASSGATSGVIVTDKMQRRRRALHLWLPEHIMQSADIRGLVASARITYASPDELLRLIVARFDVQKSMLDGYLESMLGLPLLQWLLHNRKQERDLVLVFRLVDALLRCSGSRVAVCARLQ